MLSATHFDYRNFDSHSLAQDDVLGWVRLLLVLLRRISFSLLPKTAVFGNRVSLGVKGDFLFRKKVPLIAFYIFTSVIKVTITGLRLVFW